MTKHVTACRVREPRAEGRPDGSTPASRGSTGPRESRAHGPCGTAATGSGGGMRNSAGSNRWTSPVRPSSSFSRSMSGTRSWPHRFENRMARVIWPSLQPCPGEEGNCGGRARKPVMARNSKKRGQAAFRGDRRVAAGDFEVDRTAEFCQHESRTAGELADSGVSC